MSARQRWKTMFGTLYIHLVHIYRLQRILPTRHTQSFWTILGEALLSSRESQRYGYICIQDFGVQRFKRRSEPRVLSLPSTNELGQLSDEARPGKRD